MVACAVKKSQLLQHEDTGLHEGQKQLHSRVVIDFYIVLADASLEIDLIPNIHLIRSTV